MILRPDQRACLRNVYAAFARPARAVLVVAPTGFGKTVTAGEAIRSHVSKGGDRRVVLLAHREELVAQSAATFARFGLRVGTLDRDPSAPVIVASVQAIGARGVAPRATLLVPDEAHHYVAAEWRKVLDAYPPEVRILGFTATPERADGLGLGVAGGGVFDSLVIAAQVRELVDLGVLVPSTVLGPDRMLRPDEIAQDPVEAFLRYTPHGQAVVFAPNVPTSQGYASAFVRAGIPAAHVDGKTPADRRAALLAGFAAQTVRVVCNVNVLTEGWDCPPADVCIIARGCGSQGQFLQMVGRVLRASPGKTHATILDLRGVVSVLGPPDLDRVYSLDGTAITRGDRAEAICRQCGRLLTACECEAGGKELAAPRALGEDLVDWATRYRDAKLELQPTRTELALASIMRRAALALKKGKPWKQGAVLHRFRAVFHRAPRSDETAMAHRVNLLSVPEYAALVGQARERRSA